jgi:hypothetical protein
VIVVIRDRFFECLLRQDFCPPAAALSIAAVTLAGCFSDVAQTVSGPPRCERPADGSPSFGCAVVYGTVVGPDGSALDGVSGAVRTTPQCGCRAVPIDVDSLGRFSVTVHRSEAPALSSADTATIVVYVGATAAKYPRAVTGDPYFDTSSVRLTYAPIGEPAGIYPLSLRILFPPP